MSSFLAEMGSRMVWVPFSAATSAMPTAFGSGGGAALGVVGVVGGSGLDGVFQPIKDSLGDRFSSLHDWFSCLHLPNTY